MNRTRKVKWFTLQATLIISLLTAIGACLVTALGTLFLLFNWIAGNGGLVFLVWLVYQSVLLALPILGLCLLDRRRKMAQVLQICWLVAISPLLYWGTIRFVLPVLSG